MVYRNEWKHVISYSDLLVLRQRLRAVMKIDKHAVDGKYLVRSLYFETPTDTALREKINGVSRREKFRIRYYNNAREFIFLEKKSKVAGFGNKQKAILTEQQVQRLIAGDIEWMLLSEQGLTQELYSKMHTELLRPKTVVEYEREPFVYSPGNVRVTLDYNVRTSLNCKDFLSDDALTIPAGDSPIILEVKWDEFLPDIIRDAVQLGNRRAAAYSKYAACRVYG